MGRRLRARGSNVGRGMSRRRRGLGERMGAEPLHESVDRLAMRREGLRPVRHVDHRAHARVAHAEERIPRPGGDLDVQERRVRRRDADDHEARRGAALEQRTVRASPTPAASAQATTAGGHVGVWARAEPARRSATSARRARRTLTRAPGRYFERSASASRTSSASGALSTLSPSAATALSVSMGRYPIRVSADARRLAGRTSRRPGPPRRETRRSASRSTSPAAACRGARAPSAPPSSFRCPAPG